MHTANSVIWARFAGAALPRALVVIPAVPSSSFQYYESLTYTLVKSVSIDVCIILVGSVLIYRLVHRILNGVQRKADNQTGSGVIQFVLLAPVLIAVLLVIFQVALIVQAKFVVNYAAFCAARSAIVVIPTSIRSAISGKVEMSSQINLQDPGSPKVAIIRRAASIACAGISPPLTPSLAVTTNTPLIVNGMASLQTLALLFPGNVRGTDVPQQFVLRAPYALAPENTHVALTVNKHPASDTQHASYEIVNARVTYRYYLTVPFANRLFGTRFKSSGWLTNSAYYIPIQEQYSLLSEDDPIFPESEQPPNAEFDTEASQ